MAVLHGDGLQIWIDEAAAITPEMWDRLAEALLSVEVTGTLQLTARTIEEFRAKTFVRAPGPSLPPGKNYLALNQAPRSPRRRR